MPVREIQIDDATGELLSKIFNAPDDTAVLEALGDVDPLEFRTFLAEIGELDNPDGLRLLSALEARSGISTKISFDEAPRTFTPSAPGAVRSTTSWIPEVIERAPTYEITRHVSFRRRQVFALVTLIIATVAILAIYLRPSTLSPEVTAALKNLDYRVQTMPALFDAPTPRLQSEYLTRFRDRSVERALLTTLYENRSVLPNSALERAALLAFALEDYQRAQAFVDAGLEKASGDERLLTARGVIEYGQSLYPQALSSFQLAQRASESNANLEAAIAGNEGLARWDLGQTRDAEESLKRSIALVVSGEQIYYLLTQADLYTDYGQTDMALQAINAASTAISARNSDKQARTYLGDLSRSRAKLAFLRGDTIEAQKTIDEAIRIHQQDASVFELDRDKVVKAKIELQTGPRDQAIKTLQEAVQSYENSEYVKGGSEVLLQEIELLTPQLIDLNQYEEAERLINSANEGFTRINYQRGLGECEVWRGVLILKLAGHKYLEQFHANMTPQQKRALSEWFSSEAMTSVEHFKTAIRIFQTIGYKPGVASAQDKLAINFILLDKAPSKQILSQAAQYGTDAARIYEEIGNQRGLAAAFGNLGIIYRKSKQYDLALTNLQRALQIYTNINSKLGIGRQFLNLGRLYYERGFSEKSEQHLRRAMTYFLEAQKAFTETQAADELKLTNLYLKNLSQILGPSYSEEHRGQQEAKIDRSSGSLI